MYYNLIPRFLMGFKRYRNCKNNVCSFGTILKQMVHKKKTHRLLIAMKKVGIKEKTQHSVAITLDHF